MWQNGGRGGAILTPNELVLTFGGSYVCANFSENQSRNATMSVRTDGYTDAMTDRRKPILSLPGIICPMLYAIAMGQIIIDYLTAAVGKVRGLCASGSGSQKLAICL